VLVLVGDPGLAVAEQRNGFERHGAFHVFVVPVQGADNRDGVRTQPRNVIQRRPAFVAGQRVGGLAQRPELTELLEHPREHCLPGEIRRRLRVERETGIGETRALRSPSRCRTVGIGRLVQHRVDGIRRRHHPPDLPMDPTAEHVQLLEVVIRPLD